MIIIFDGAFLVLAVFILFSLVTGGLGSVINFYTEHITLVIIFCIIAVAAYTIFVFLYTKKGEMDGSPIINGIVAVFSSAQFVCFAIYTLYIISRAFNNGHLLNAIFISAFYFIVFGLELCALTLITVDDDGFLGSFVANGLLLGIAGWLLNLFIYV